MRPLLTFDMILDACSSEWLSEAVREEKVLVLDCRPPADFAKCHIKNSVNISIPTLLQRRLKTGNLTVCNTIQCAVMKQIFLQRWKSVPVILCDSTSSPVVPDDPSSLIKLLLEKLSENGCTVKYLVGGFSDFSLRYTDLLAEPKEDAGLFGMQNLALEECEKKPAHPIAAKPEISPETPSPSFPVEVINGLYLGNAKNATDLPSLEKYNIQYILNVTPNLPNLFENGVQRIKYKQIPINDHWSQNLSVYFPEAIQFIDEGLSQGVGVLVHCLAGISRSVTVTVAYLMARKQMSLNDAYDFVKNVKPNISPNFNFMGQLLDFEQTLLKCTCSPDSRCECVSKQLHFMTPTRSTPNYELEAPPSCELEPTSTPERIVLQQ